MLHLAICDDELNEIDVASDMIKQILKNQVIVSKHFNPFSLLTYVCDEVKGNIDLIILDINLAGQNGIEVAKSILGMYPEIKIIFMTKFIERVKDIFQISPIYFLVKPLEMEYLRAALYKVIELIDEENTNTFVVKIKQGNQNLLMFKVRNIYYLESDMRLIYIHENEGFKSVYMKLDEAEKELPSNFCRCHQSFLVNMDKIRIVTNEEIILFNEVHIPISRSKKKEVLEKIREYLGIYD